MALPWYANITLTPLGIVYIFFGAMLLGIAYIIIMWLWNKLRNLF